MKKNQALYFVSRSLAKPSVTGENVDEVDKRGHFRQLKTRPSTANAVATFPIREGNNLPSREGRLSRRLNRVSFILVSSFCFALALLSLFTLNYSSIFNLSAPTVHAADVNSTDGTSSAQLSISVPTSIALSITSTNGDSACDDTSTNTLCLKWNDDGKQATGSQTVSVQTNNPTGYTVTVDNGDGNLRGVEDSVKDQTIPLDVEPTDNTNALAKTTTMNSNANKVVYNWTATPNSPNYLTSEGTYTNKVAYIATANDADTNTVEPDATDKVNTVYNFAYTGHVQTFTAPYEGKYKVEVWGASGTYSSPAGYSVGEINLDSRSKLYIAAGQAGSINMRSYSFNGGGYVTCKNGDGGGGATSIQLSLIGDGQLRNYEGSKEQVLIVAGGGGGRDGTNRVSKDGSEYFGSGGGYVGNYGASPNERGGTGDVAWWGVRDNHVTPGGQSADTNFTPNWDELPAGFGYGGSEINKSDGDDCGGAGGGGWYGGQAKTGFGIGAGGSGYIGNPLLTNKHMYGYNVPISDEENTKTISGTCASETPTSGCAKIGNGYARITYLGRIKLTR